MIESSAISLSEKKFHHLIERDIESFSSMFDEKGLMFYPTGKVETKPELLQRLASGRTVFEKIDLAKTIARLYEETAVVHGEGMFTLMLQGERIIENLNFIDVWVKKEEEWKLVSSHFIKMV
ncbi:nuclear transport factor 2 family protein [Algoriphagus aquatilis]|uniref:Nuclear transport factor 2 family protein n=1 Tax=Algoriphagus aquatilis TaxID=490186 RepID=A0ABW0BTF8_9BACT